jgi:hypothetical protein
MRSARSILYRVPVGARRDAGVSADAARRLRFERQAPMKKIRHFLLSGLRRKNVAASGNGGCFSAAVAGVVARNEPHFRGRNHLWDVVNEGVAHRGRDWAEVAISAPAAGARFSHQAGDTTGVNAKPAGIYNLVRDVKAHGCAGLPATWTTGPTVGW